MMNVIHANKVIIYLKINVSNVIHNVWVVKIYRNVISADLHKILIANNVLIVDK